MSCSWRVYYYLLFIWSYIRYRTKRSIMITGLLLTCLHQLYYFFSISFSNPILVLSIMKHISLDNLKNCGSIGSYRLILTGKFRLVGSRINWQVVSSLCKISSKFILFLVSLHIFSYSLKIFSLSAAIARHVDTTWLTDSSWPEVHNLHRGEPPDWLALVWYVR